MPNDCLTSSIAFGRVSDWILWSSSTYCCLTAFSACVHRLRVRRVSLVCSCVYICVVRPCVAHLGVRHPGLGLAHRVVGVQHVRKRTTKSSGRRRGAFAQRSTPPDAADIASICSRCFRTTSRSPVARAYPQPSVVSVFGSPTPLGGSAFSFASNRVSYSAPLASCKSAAPSGLPRHRSSSRRLRTRRRRSLQRVRGRELRVAADDTVPSTFSYSSAVVHCDPK